MDPTKFTQASQESLQKALQSAQGQNHSMVEPVHLLSALLFTSGSAQDIITSIVGDQKDALSLQLEQLLETLPTISSGEPAISSDLSKILAKAFLISQQQKDEFVPQEWLLLSLVENAPEVLKKVIHRFGLTAQNVKAAAQKLRDGNTVNSAAKDSQYKVLDKYTTNFTILAKEGKLDPVIGRDTEIRRVMQVLSRRTKNNPVLIGEPGVGKTAIAEGLAQRIVSGDVPDSLKHKQILSLEMASVLAGAKYRGEFEERLKSIIDEVQKQSGQVIVFIDEMHTISGAGAAEGAVNAANMLKPGLARGTLRVIGATTLDEYRQYIEKDAALERRFQPVFVNPPSVLDTIAILRGLKEKYELHHGIRILDDALVSAAQLSDRYIQDRFLPDKAIDLIDEAASGLKIQAESAPEELDTLRRNQTQLEIELKALDKEKTEASKTRKATLQKELADIKEKVTLLNSRYRTQKELIEKIQKERNALDLARAQLERAEREVNLDEAAKIKFGDIPGIQKRLDAMQAEWVNIPSDQLLIKQEVTPDDIAAVIARWTGIPVTKLIKSETKKLTELEKELGNRVIGQEDALKAVANAVRRSRAGIAEENKPIASLLFLGPTGVGKTETAKALAEVLFEDERQIIRFDMSEYTQEHTVARLIGAPPGYVGYEAAGQLTEAVRRRPYSVILLDEIEKAHPKIFTLFLQIFDAGRLTDSQGRTINFKNTVIIMTSNLGAKIIQEAGDKLTQNVQNQVWDLIRSTFPPEFINRLDQIVMFEPLTRNQIIKIVDLQIQELQNRLVNQNLKLKVSNEAKEYLANTGYDPIYGARPLKRLIQTEILDPASLLILDEQIKNGTITVDAKKNHLIVS